MENGYFNNKNEYVITNMHPIRPLKNYLWNNECVAYYDQFGFGLPNMHLPTGFRFLNFEEHLVYIKNHYTEEYYSPNRNYEDLPFDVYECHVGRGYQNIISEYKGVRVEYMIMIPTSGKVEISRISIVNLTNNEINLDVYHLLRPNVNITWHTTYSEGKYDKKNEMLVFSHIGYDIDDKYAYIYAKADYPLTSFDVSARYFKGFYRNYDRPIGLENDKLSCTPTTFEDQFVSAMHFNVVLKAKQLKVIHIACGMAKNEKNMISDSNKYANKEFFDSELNSIQLQTKDVENVFTLESDDPILDIQINTWLKRQISLGKSWGRVYGKGFRDIMQDISSFVSFDKETAKDKILKTLQYQKIDGNTIRQFDPIFDYPYRDGASWIPGTILAYLKETNDLSLLSEKIPYYQNDNKETVLQHMIKGLDFLLNGIGKHGLVLWGGGDWNDSLNNCGRKGIGESVWLSIATIKALHEFYEIIEHYQLNVDLEWYKGKEEKLKAAIKEYGYKDGYFIYGYNDEGKIIGGNESEEGKIFLNPQTWAILSEVVNNDEGLKLLDIVENKLKTPFGYAQVYPSYSKGDNGIGRASFFKPGTYENGSCYLHGVSFKIAADLKLNKADQAYETLRAIRYDNPYNSTSGMEPYAVSNMFIGPECDYLKGYAPLSWITGTAGWLYRSITEMMFGIKPYFSSLYINPCLPSNFTKVNIVRIFQEETFEITIEKTGEFKIIYDDKKVNSPYLPLKGKGKKHNVYYSF